MGRANKFLAMVIVWMLLLSAMRISVRADSNVSIAEAGTSLMTTLLDRQYASFIDGSDCDTSDIMTDSESNQFYNCYLKWYLGAAIALGGRWTKYEYDLSLKEVNGNTLTFSSAVEYWIEGHDSRLGNWGIEYELTVDKIGADFYITEIHSTAGDYNDFERLIGWKAEDYGFWGSPDIQTIDQYVDELIVESRKTEAGLKLFELSYARENFVPRCALAAFGRWKAGDHVTAMAAVILVHIINLWL